MRLTTVALTMCYLLVAARAPSARGDIIVSLDVHPSGTFALFLEDDNLGDTAGTFGIASYGVPLLGSISALDHLAPQGITNALVPVGFSEFRSADNDPIIGASQNTIVLGRPLVPGFGRQAGTLASYIGSATLLGGEQTSYDRKLKIAEGSWNVAGMAPSVNVASVDFVGTVFENSSLSGAPRAIRLRLAAVPEPSSFFLCLAACAAIGTRLSTHHWKRVHYCRTSDAKCQHLASEGSPADFSA